MQFEHFLIFMTDQKRNKKTKMLVWLHGKKFQIGWILLKTAFSLFCVNFKPNIQAAVIMNLFLKPEDLCVVSFST